DALEGARPCRARIRPAAELDGRQDCAHHWHRAGEVQDWHDEPRLQHPPAGSARADGSCTRLSALTGGLRVPSCKGPRGRRTGVKTVPDRGLTSAQTLQPLAQLRQKSPKASIVRGSLKLLQDPRSGVQISLMVSGISDGKHAPGLLSLGTVYTNPYWIFYSSNERFDRLSQLKGKRIAVGPEGSGTRASAEQIL